MELINIMLHRDSMDDVPSPPSSPLSDLPPSSPPPHDPDIDSPPHTPRPRNLSTPIAAQATLPRREADLTPLSRTIADDGRVILGAEGSDPGVFWSSPAETTEDRRRKGWTLAAAGRRGFYEQRAEDAREEREEATVEREGAMKRVLNILDEAGLTVADLVAYVFHPSRFSRQWRWDQFFSKPDALRQLLRLCISSDVPPSVQSIIQTFANRYVLGKLKQEADVITRGGILRIAGRPFDSSLVLGLDFRTLAETLTQWCPTLMHFLTGIITTTRQEKKNTPEKKKQKQFVSWSV